MKSEYHETLDKISLLLPIHLLVSTFLLCGTDYMPIIVFFGISYFLAFPARNYLWGNQFLDLPQEMKKHESSPRWLFFFGKLSEDNEHLRKKLQDLNQRLSMARVSYQYLFLGAWIFVGGYFIQSKFGIAATPVWSFLFVIALTLLISSYQNVQFLASLCWSAFLSIIALAKAPISDGWIFIPQLILSLVIFVEIRKIQKKSKASKTPIESILISALVITFMTAFVYKIIKPVPKLKASSQQSIKTKAIDKLARKIAKYSDNQRASSQASSTNSGSPNFNTKSPSEGSGLPKSLTEGSGAPAEPPEGTGNPGDNHSSKQTSGQSKMEQKLEKQIQQLEQQLKQTQNSATSPNADRSHFDNGNSKSTNATSSASQKQMEQQLKQLKKMETQLLAEKSKKSQSAQPTERSGQQSKLTDQQLSQVQKQIQNLQKQIQQTKGSSQYQNAKSPTSSSSSSSPHKTQGAPPSTKDLQQQLDQLKKLQKQMQSNSGTSGSNSSTGSTEKSIGDSKNFTGDRDRQKAQGSDQSYSNDGNPQNSSRSNSSPSQQSASKQKPLNNDVKDIQHSKQKMKDKINKIKEDINKIVNLFGLLFKILAGALGVFVVYKILLYMKKRTPLEEEPPKKKELSPIDKRLLAQQFQRLQQAKLTPEEEVLQTYALFLQTMHLMEFARENWRTPTDFQRRVNEEFKVLHESSEVITEAYCDLSYGKIPVDDDQLKQLRSAREQFMKKIA